MKIKNFFEVLFKFREYKNWKDIIQENTRDKNPTKVVLKSGVTISASARNSILRGVKRIFLRNTYNPTNYKIGVNDTVVDIGANIGIFTLYAANKTKKRFYSFEPFPANFKYLQQNIRLSGFNYVTPHLTTISDKVDTRKYFVNEST